jgi:serine/threonine-protein kinase
LAGAVGPYQILEKLGSGGMGEVFLGHDPRLDRRVALKCLTSVESGTHDGRTRILREARAAARLTHAHIAGVYDVLEESGRMFIVMEYVEGVSLAAHLAGGARPSQEVRAIGRQLASALTAAHTQGVIHRDLKPGNIQVMRDGSIKVLDFGVAKLTTPVPTSVETTSGEVIVDKTVAGNPGTPIYMAPEQLLNRPIDARCDIYSAGAILFLMATGRRPYEETTAVGLALAMNAGPVPPAHSINPLVSLELSATIAKALERDPTKRYQSARELDAALAGLESTKTRAVAGPDETTRTFPSSASHARRWVWLVAASVLLTVGIAERTRIRSWFGPGGAPAATLGNVAESGLAVLPLANLSADPNQEYVADGLTEAIIAELGRVRSLRVISRRSVMRYKQSTAPVPQIARELGVGAVMTGSVTRDGDQLHITIALVQPSPERQLWSETYDRRVGDMVTLSGEVAQAAVQQLQAAVTPQERAALAKARPVNADAYQAYLLGRYYWNKRTKPDIERAIAEFRRAIALDPNSALAYAGLADSYVIAWDNSYLSAQEAYREGKANASKAIRLDEGLAEAHASLAVIYYFGAIWRPAEEEFRRALALNPGYATAHQWLALTMSTLGRHTEAIAEARRALELDPISPLQNAQLGQRLYLGGDYDAAVAQFRKTIALDPTFYFAHDLLGRTYIEQKQYAAALQELETASRLEGAPSPNLGYGYAIAGNTAAATAVLEQQLAKIERGEAYPDHAAIIHVGLGQYDDAIRWYTKAYEQDEGVVKTLAIDPRLTPLSRDPRFVALLQKSGLTFSPGRPRS